MLILCLLVCHHYSLPEFRGGTCVGEVWVKARLDLLHALLTGINFYSHVLVKTYLDTSRCRCESSARARMGSAVSAHLVAGWAAGSYVWFVIDRLVTTGPIIG